MLPVLNTSYVMCLLIYRKNTCVACQYQRLSCLTVLHGFLSRKTNILPDLAGAASCPASCHSRLRATLSPTVCRVGCQQALNCLEKVLAGL